MSMNTTTNKLLELPLLTTELRASVEQLRELADGGWVSSILYGRASQDRQKRMRSIDGQITDMVTWCSHFDWRPDAVIRDADRSASQWRRREREGFDQAMALIESGKYGGFATWEPSRAGRDMEIYVQLRKACQRAGVLYLTHSRICDFSRSDDTFMMGIEFLRAEADANTMRERQLRTVKINADKGRPHGRLPYGYRRVYDQHTGVLLRQEPDPHTGQIVRDAAREVLAGKSMYSIAMRMQDAGEPTPKEPWVENPRGWDTYTVRQVLQNPTIAGKRVYRGEVIGEAQWEPLISWEDFQKIQRLFADPARRVKGGGGMAAKTLMVHIARCHYCGRPLKRATLRRKNKKPAVKYQCQFRGCYKTMISQPGLDAYVEQVVLEWFQNPANLGRLTGDHDGDWLKAADAAEQRRAALQARLDEAIDQYATGSLNLDTLTKLEAALRPQIAEAEQALIPPVTDERVRALVTAEDVPAAWAALPLAERRKIIKAAFNVRIRQTQNRGQNSFEVERVLIEPRAL
ncbi:recombinase family protein [Kocuria sp. 2SI]|uniref:recombinase family protein n=1 Tax=Kocuria sp. 2SI TaxID=2502203 RepID=UPI0010F56FF5|nr:recombinase family protein [Kocuria sp. 2SI]